MSLRNILVATALSLTVSCSYSQTVPKTALPEKSTQGVSVIELFTSEGCSSCPPADALMPKLQEQYGDQLIILAFHVDYWDKLGWKDVFSRPEWTRRQNQYAAALGTDNIYTPQAVVNGRAHTTGSNASGIRQLIGHSLSPASSIALSAKPTPENAIQVNYKTTLKNGTVLNLALVQRHATTNVRRGENGGRQLQHYHVVREFRTVQRESGTEIFPLPEGLSAGEVEVVAYVQHSGNLHILAATEAAIAP